MKRQNARILAIVGAVVIGLCIILIIIGVLDYNERSEYQNLTPNLEGVIPVGLALIGGVAATIVGIKKMNLTGRNSD